MIDLIVFWPPISVWDIHQGVSFDDLMSYKPENMMVNFFTLKQEPEAVLVR